MLDASSRALACPELARTFLGGCRIVAASARSRVTHDRSSLTRTSTARRTGWSLAPVRRQVLFETKTGIRLESVLSRYRAGWPST